jgi:hypothetical protein
MTASMALLSLAPGRCAASAAAVAERPDAAASDGGADASVVSSVPHTKHVSVVVGRCRRAALCAALRGEGRAVPPPALGLSATSQSRATADIPALPEPLRTHTSSLLAVNAPPLSTPPLLPFATEDEAKAEVISSKMLGGASQTVSKTRVKCNGT